MPSCGAPDCTNRSSKDSKRTFHTLPAVESRKALIEAWLLKIKRKHIPNYLYICSDRPFWSWLLWKRSQDKTYFKQIHFAFSYNITYIFMIFMT